MKYKIKVGLFKFLELFPDSLGNQIYYLIQSVGAKFPLDKKLKSIEATHLRLAKVLKELQVDLKDKVVFEFGTGWFPGMPYLFIYKDKAAKVLTYDINEHFNTKTVDEFNALFSENFDCSIVTQEGAEYNLPKEVEYYPKHNIVKEKLPVADVVFSRYVLSHMREDDVIELHSKIKKEYPPNTIIIHFISPSDLRQHGDASLSLQDFLKYSKTEWDNIHTRFNYHNRLRLPQFIDIFKKAELEVLFLTYNSLQKDTHQYELFKKVKLHNDYKDYSDEELTAGDIVVILKT